MKKTKSNPRTAKGAVLIMVITIMFVLIFLLAGTIAVVYSSHNATLNKYKQSQAYYTSRSLLDTFLFTFLQDDVLYVGKNGIGTTVDTYTIDATTAVPTVKKTNDTTQGRALELDIYSLGVDLQESAAGVQTVFNFNNSTYDVSDAPDWALEFILQTANNDENAVANLVAEAVGAGKTRPANTSDAVWATALYKDKTKDPATGRSEKYKDAVYVAELLINPRVGEMETSLIESGNLKPGVTADDQDDSKAGFDYPVPWIVDDSVAYSGVDSSSVSYSNFYNQYIPKDTTGNLISRSTASSKVIDTLTYMVKGSEIINFAQNTLSDGSHKIIDYDLSGADDPDCNAYIYVKILERKYSAGSGDSFKAKFDTGNRRKDYVKLLITCVTPYDGRFTETSVIFSTNYTPDPNNNNALTALGNIDASTSGFNIGGGFSSINSTPVKLDANNIVGSIFTGGDLIVNTSNKTTLPGGKSLVVLGNLYGRNTQEIQSTGDNAFVYVGGAIKSKMPDGGMVNSFQLTGSKPVNLLVDTIELPQNGISVAGGNIYSNRISYNTSNDNKIWGAGNIYTNILEIDKNFLEMNPPVGLTTAGVPATLKLKRIAGTTPVYVTDTIVIKNYYSDNSGTEENATYGWTKNDLVIHQSVKGFNFDNTSGSNYLTSTTKVELGYRTPAHYGNKLDEFYRKTFKMPDGTTYSVDTIRSKYNSFYTEECFVTDDTALTGTLGDFAPGFDRFDTTDPTKSLITAESKAKKYTGVDSCIIPGSPDDSPTDDFYKLTANSTISGGKYLFDTEDVGTVTINTTPTKDTVIQLAPSGSDSGRTYIGKFNISGNGHVVFLIPEDGKQYFLGRDGYDFLVNYIPSGIFSTQKVFTGEVSSPNTPTVPPNVDIFIGGESKVKLYGGGSFVTGYVYGPKSTVSVNTSCNGKDIEYHENESVSNTKSWLAGSCFCGTYNNANVGVAFIPRNVDTSVDGESVLRWEDVLYTRG